jgi:hypothetical protein
MGLITKKDVIRNMASLEENDGDEEDDQDFNVFEAQEGGLLDEEERGSDESLHNHNRDDEML